MAVLAAALASATQAGAQNAAALSGEVRTSGAGPLEGVVVSARKDQSTITHSVISDARGRYAFARNRLSPGRYTLSIRATGYELDGAAAADIGAGSATRDLNLKKAADLAA